MENKTITPSMKLADLIELNYKLIALLPRFDIGLGFGEETLAEACEVHGINVASFILICNQYTVENYVPSADLLASADLKDIVTCMHNSHISLREEMRDLEDLLIELIAPTDATQKRIVQKFYTDYKNEVNNHFDYEEFTVFPYVEGLLINETRPGFSVDIVEENHSNINEKLSDLKNIVMKYLPTCCDSFLRNKALFMIFSVEEDLRHHTDTEDNILIPLANMLESNE
ncbi:MAG: hemerythrin domain-containing protein [Bacteroidales bacterium]|nr:hemerythrin domain-containing protein [Bacteroidales bacterium]